MQGVWTALITPFNEKNEIDLPAFKKILQDQIQAGVSGVIPCGTTGESPTLSTAEKKTLILTTLQEVKGTGLKVGAGTGSNNTAESIEFSVWASQQGVDAVLLVSPYYNKPSQAGLEAHFRAIADAIQCEVILYNVPGRTGVSMTAETIVSLASHPRIRSIKETTGNVAFTSELLRELSLNDCKMDILSGDDVLFLPLLSIGAVGVISVASNLFPRAMIALHQAVKTGQQEEALRLHNQYYPLFRDLFIDANPIPIKHAMSVMERCHSRVRLPLVTLSEKKAKTLESALIQCKIYPGSLA